MLSGRSTHPGSGNAANHESEYQIFEKILDEVENIHHPVMIELGCHWALWSLCFKKRFPNGQNVLIELGKQELAVGERNFELNNFNAKSYWGGLFLEQSGTYKPEFDFKIGTIGRNL